jgi:LmbE family N-acetylglucosaminyl deacetylase
MGSHAEGSPVLAVCAHPDDESFGLGAALAAFAGRGTPTAVLCLTHGAASSLGTSHGDLHQIRAAELAAAAAELGVGDVELLDYPDGALTQVPVELLSGHVQQAARRVKARLLLVFDEGGITGHPDHQQATRAARLFAGRSGLPVLAWAVDQQVAATLNAAFGTSFVGRPTDQIDCYVEVDRQRQLSAITCHASQAQDNPVLWRRLELQGTREVFRWLDRADENQGRASARRKDALAATGAACALPGERSAGCHHGLSGHDERGRNARGPVSVNTPGGIKVYPGLQGG